MKKNVLIVCLIGTLGVLAIEYKRSIDDFSVILKENENIRTRMKVGMDLVLKFAEGELDGMGLVKWMDEQKEFLEIVDNT